jgi:hypothetical protein
LSIAQLHYYEHAYPPKGRKNKNKKRIRPITQAILFGQTNSIIGRNVLSSCSRHHVSVDDIMALALGHHDIGKLIIQSNQSAATDDWLIELVH